MDLHNIELTLPLTNPVLLFTVILFIILFAPIVLNKLKIPPLIGLIIAGAIIGPNGLNLMLRDSSIILFGTVGLLYIMFLAGLEIDLADFKKNTSKSIVFGLYTFMIPMVLGILVSLYVLDFSPATSVLLASMFASHTLIAYPIISKLGITKNRAVTVAVGGTMITDTLALLVLTVITGMVTGALTDTFWIELTMSVLIFGLVVLLLGPVTGRWFFKRYDDNISQYIFVLAMVFLAAFLAETAKIEAILGAFLAGLALNRLIPRTSPLMNRIEFVGNALFIPFFLIGVGMLVDYRAIIKDFEAVKVALVMTVVATIAKFLAAWATQKTFGFSRDERRVIFGLSNAQAAATLAAVLVGYNIIIAQTEDGELIRLLGENVLNGTILMILVTCTIASFAAQKGAQNIVLSDAAEDGISDSESDEERILIPISNLESAEELVNLSLTIKSKTNKTGLFALHVIHNGITDEVGEKQARKILEKASKVASATDSELHPLLRYDLNIINGITSVVKEHKITDLILGLHRKTGISDSFFGTLTTGILTRCNTTTMIYKSVQPLSTIKRTLVILPDNAEREVGFPFWLIKVWNIGKNTGSQMVFYGTQQTIDYLKEIQKKHTLEAEFRLFDDWHDFLVLSREVGKDDSLVIVLSRKYHISYHSVMSRIPTYLNKYFQANNFILVYPMQSGVPDTANEVLGNPSVLEPLKENIERLDQVGKLIAKLFRRK